MIRNIPAVVVLTFALAGQGLLATGAEPLVAEVYDALRTNLPGMTREQLDKAAVDALVAGFKPRVSLQSIESKEAQSDTGPVLAKVSSFDTEIGYLRVTRVTSGIDAAVRSAVNSLASTNKLKGLVLDLRYAKGGDYSAAAALAQLFIRKEQPLLNWGEGLAKTKANPEAINLPVATLVNRETARAAEALAAVLREAGVALILGSRTAGEALIFREIPLSNGDRLRVATGPVQLGGGTALSTDGVKPDIAVQVSAEDERVYYADSFKVIARTNTVGTNELAGGSTTNRMRRPRYNEAELVRERREGLNLEELAGSPREPQPEKPMVHDPVLARGIDVLKGLAVVRPGRS